VETKGEKILIDCGPDFRQQYLKYDLDKFDSILITHEHFDHVGGLDDLRPADLFADMNIYTEKYCANHLRERIPYCFIPKELRYPGVPSINLICIEPRQAFKIGKVEILPIRVMHGSLPILGYRIGKFAYITDMSSISDTDKALLEGVDTMVVNGLRYSPHPSHQSVSQAIDFVRQLNVRRAFITHLTHDIGPYAIANKRMPQGIDFAYDGLEFTV
jgi:phosphoribosyl 1,2-cyclic phosphate phosphodiesterase